MSEDYQLPHEPSRDRLWTTGLFKAADNRYFWYHRSHHILIDGFAGGLVARRVAELYGELHELRTPELVPFGSLIDLVTEDHAYRESDRYEVDRNYWVSAFADKPLPVSLGHYRPSPKAACFAARRCWLRISSTRYVPRPAPHRAVTRS